MQQFIKIENTKYNLSQIVEISPLIDDSCLMVLTNGSIVEFTGDSAIAVDRYFNDERISRNLLPDDRTQAYQTYLDGGTLSLEAWQAAKLERKTLASQILPSGREIESMNAIDSALKIASPIA